MNFYLVNIILWLPPYRIWLWGTQKRTKVKFSSSQSHHVQSEYWGHGQSPRQRYNRSEEMPCLLPQVWPGQYGGAQAEAGHRAQSAGRDGRPVQVTNHRQVFRSRDPPRPIRDCRGYGAWYMAPSQWNEKLKKSSQTINMDCDKYSLDELGEFKV